MSRFNFPLRCNMYFNHTEGYEDDSFYNIQDNEKYNEQEDFSAFTNINIKKMYASLVRNMNIFEFTSYHKRIPIFPLYNFPA